MNSLSQAPATSITTSFSFLILQLLQHIKSGDLSKIKCIFDAHSKDKIEIYWKHDNFDFVSPIHEAAESGRNHVLRYLLSPSIGFDINELTSHGSHVLHLAAYRGKIHTVKLLIDEYDVSPEIRTTESKCTPLILASRNGHDNVVRVLVETYGANINYYDYSGSTALHRAAGWNQTHIVEYLVCERDADMEITREDDGYTCLMLAVYYNKWESVDLLLDLGANIENVCAEECTPVHIAMERNNYKSLYYLVCRGADIDRVCKGCTVRSMADYGTFELRQSIEEGLVEYNTYYEQISSELNRVVNHVFCDDIIEAILDMTYPKPVLLQDDKPKECKKGTKRKVISVSSETYEPPTKKQRLE